MMRLFDLPLRYLFGRDVFISYARADSATYAPRLANKITSGNKGVSCYLDQYAAPPGATLPRSLKRHLRWSNLLVLVGSPAAVRSLAIRQEIAEFAKSGRPVIPVDVDGSLDELDWEAEPWVSVSGAARQLEGRLSFEGQYPSDSVVRRVENSIKFTRHSARIRRAITATCISVAALILIGLVLLYLAQQETARQQSIAEALDLANQSTELVLIDKSTRGLVQSSRRAVQSVQASATVEGNQAMRRVLRLLGTRTSRLSYENATVKALSPDGGTLALDESKELVVLNNEQGTRQTVAGVDPTRVWCVGGQRIAYVNEATLHVVALDGSEDWAVDVAELMVERTRPYSVALSPDGRHIAISVRSWDDEFSTPGEELDYYAIVFNVNDGSRAFELPIRTSYESVWDIAFSADGKRIAISGRAISLGGQKVGYVRAWELSAWGDKLTLDVELPTLYETDSIDEVACSGAEGHIAVSTAGMVRVWQMDPRGQYHELARLPGSFRNRELAITADGQIVTIAGEPQVSEGKETRSKDGETGSLSTWAIDGFDPVATIENSVAASFTADGKRLLIHRRLPSAALESVEIGSWHETTLVQDDADDAVAFSLDGNWVAVEGPGSTITLHDTIRNVTRADVVLEQMESIRTMALSPDGSFLATYSWRDDTIRVRELADDQAKIVRRIEHEMRHPLMVLSSRGDYLAAVDRKQPVRIWMTRSGDDVTPSKLSTVTDISKMAVNCDRGLFGYVTASGKLGIWDIEKGRGKTFTVGQRALSATGFSADGTLVAAGGVDGSISILDVDSGTVVTQLNARDTVVGVAFSTDTKYLAAATHRELADDKIELVTVWSISQDQLTRETLARLKQYEESGDF